MAASIGRQAGRQAEGAGEGVPWTANMNGSRKGGKHTGGKAHRWQATQEEIEQSYR